MKSTALLVDILLLLRDYRAAHQSGSWKAGVEQERLLRAIADLISSLESPPDVIEAIRQVVSIEVTGFKS